MQRALCHYDIAVLFCSFSFFSMSYCFLHYVLTGSDHRHTRLAPCVYYQHDAEGLMRQKQTTCRRQTAGVMTWSTHSVASSSTLTQILAKYATPSAALSSCSAEYALLRVHIRQNKNTAICYVPTNAGTGKRQDEISQQLLHIRVTRISEIFLLSSYTRFHQIWGIGLRKITFKILTTALTLLANKNEK